MKERKVYFIQLITLSLNWVLAVSVTWWFVHLVKVAHELNDMQTASISISIIAIIIFWVLSGVLTYVFFGLHKDE
ncbi:MAG: hypothetical protein ACP5US_02340 [Candidatus Kryptoniota bacterium]